jgi:hypothetical protein
LWLLLLLLLNLKILLRLGFLGARSDPDRNSLRLLFRPEAFYFWFSSDSLNSCWLEPFLRLRSENRKAVEFRGRAG